jgi:hypothetical protein
MSAFGPTSNLDERFVPRIDSASNSLASNNTELDQKALVMEIKLSTADTKYMVFPWSGSVVGAYTVLDAATTAGAETITLDNHASTALTGGVITIATGSAAGTIDSCTPTDNNTFTVGEKLEITIGGESTTSGFATLTVLYQIT